MSNIPQGWTTAFLSDVARWSSGGTPSRKTPSFYSGDIPWIKTGELGAQYLRHAEEHISQDALNNSAAKLFVKGTVVLAMYGATIGKASILAFDASTNQACAAGFPDGVGSLFLYYFLLSQRNAFVDAGKGGAQPNISQGIVKDWPIRVPPEAEQTRIVDKLEELLSDLDAGVAELKAAQKKLAQYRQSLLKAAVEGRLTETWRAQHGNTSASEESGAQLLTRILRERRARWEAKQLAKFEAQGKAPTKGWQAAYPEPATSDIAGLPELPSGWVWSRIGQCFYVGVGATPSRKLPAYWDGETPWVSSGEVRFNRISATKEHISSLGLQNSSTRINPIGSVMLGMIGEGKTRGQVAILDIEAANNQNCAAIWATETDIAPEYVYYWLWSRYDETRRDSSGNNQPALNKSIVEAIPFPIPPIKELTAIVALVEAGMTEASNQDAALDHALRQSAAQRENILQAAFSGQLVAQDPNDEPASVLLARIRAERASQPAKLRKPRASSKVADTPETQTSRNTPC